MLGAFIYGIKKAGVVEEQRSLKHSLLTDTSFICATFSVLASPSSSEPHTLLLATAKRGLYFFAHFSPRLVPFFFFFLASSMDPYHTPEQERGVVISP